MTVEKKIGQSMSPWIQLRITIHRTVEQTVMSGELQASESVGVEKDTVAVATTSTEVNSRKKRRRNEKTLKQGMVPQRLERKGEGSLDLSFVNVLSEEADVLERLKAFGVSAEDAEHRLEVEAEIIPDRSRSENVT